ncbi:MAG: histidine kinase [Oscillatoriales cyanobacterium C42_A2020_001]|nr:histidine kinase [Leptolyngbyaceae cyanobacterium C42_A2020_001]
MNPTSASDVSLYELALQSESPPSALPISPSTLKSISDSLVNLLIEQEIPAIVWAKFPRGDVWRTGLEQYASLEGMAQAIYLFAQQRDDSDAANDDEKVSAIATTVKAPVFTIQLPPESSLRREYFLFIWSAQFKGGVFAHRPRSVQAFKPPEQTALSFDVLTSYGQPSQLLDSTQERKQLLLALCSFETPLIERVLQGLEQAIAAVPLQFGACSTSALVISPSGAAIELIQHWQSLVSKIPPTSTNSVLLGQLISSQIQYQEELWHRNSLYRKQAEQSDSLRLQNEELTNTLRLKDEFLNNVGQELRTPLTTIKTALSLLNSPSIKPPQRQRYMDLITKECDRQSSLITSLLDLAHLDQTAEQAALPPVRLVDVVPSVVSTYQPVAEEKGVLVSYTIPEDLPAVACMTNWLKQIVINLLHNGIKYTLEGGNVWVRAKQQGDYVQLEVRDTGIGIAPTEIPKIFDRFYRVRQSADDSSGAGLGLTIVQQLLLHCGGSISVKSKLSEGSTFNVLFPIYKGPAEHSVEADRG